MRRTLISLFFIASTMSILSCQKQERIDSLETHDGDLCTVTINCHVPGMSGTKAAGIDAPDHQVERLDLYEFSYPDYNFLNHKVLTSTEDIVLRDVYASSHVVIFMANLDETTADRLEKLPLKKWSEKEYGAVFYSDVFKPNHPLMLGSVFARFFEDTTYEVNLYRYFFKIEVGNVNVVSGIPELQNADIKIRRIALTNMSGFVTPLSASATSPSGINSCNTMKWLFGTKHPLEESAFGSVETGYSVGGTFPYSDGTFELYDARTQPIGERKYFVNFNFYYDRKELYLDATGNAAEGATHVFNESESLIAHTGGSTQEYTKTVNRTLYGVPTSRMSTESMVSLPDSNAGDDTTKLVLELEINGKTYFYPIRINQPQPNTCYKVEKITIKSLGSAYPNFYEKYPTLDVELSVAPWDDVEIDNIICNE